MQMILPMLRIVYDSSRLESDIEQLVAEIVMAEILYCTSYW